MHCSTSGVVTFFKEVQGLKVSVGSVTMLPQNPLQPVLRPSGIQPGQNTGTNGGLVLPQNPVRPAFSPGDMQPQLDPVANVGQVLQQKHVRPVFALEGNKHEQGAVANVSQSVLPEEKDVKAASDVQYVCASPQMEKYYNEPDYEKDSGDCLKNREKSQLDSLGQDSKETEIKPEVSSSHNRQILNEKECEKALEENNIVIGMDKTHPGKSDFSNYSFENKSVMNSINGENERLNSDASASGTGTDKQSKSGIDRADGCGMDDKNVGESGIDNASFELPPDWFDQRNMPTEDGRVNVNELGSDDESDMSIMGSFPVRASGSVAMSNPSLSIQNITSNNNQGDFIKVGETFENVIVMRERLDEYARKKKFHFIIRDSKKYNGGKNLDKKLFPKRWIHFVCRHYGLPDPKGTGERPRQKYIKTDCKCQVKCILDEANEKYELQFVQLVHYGHENTKESFERDTFERKLTESEQVKFIDDDLVLLKAKPSRVLKKIERDTNKKLKAQDLRNYCYRRMSNGKLSEPDQLIAFLQEHIDENSDTSVVVHVSQDNNDRDNSHDVIRAVFVQTKAMKEYFASFPEVVHVDSCHNVLSNGYCVTIYSAVDHTKKGKMIGFTIMCGESKVIHEASLASLIECTEPETIDRLGLMVLDKSYAEMGAGSELLENISFVLCRFHVKQAFLRKLNSCQFGQNGADDKKFMKERFDEMIFGATKCVYDEAFSKIKALHKKSKACAIMANYVEKSWHVNKHLFAFHMLKGQLTLGSLTNNIAENRFMRLKQHVPKESTLVKVTQALLTLSEEDVLKSKEDLYEMRNSVYRPSNLKDELEEELVRLANPLVDKTVIDLLLKQLRSSFSLDTLAVCNVEKDSVQCARKEGKCSFSATYVLPCMHVFAVRMFLGDLILTKPMLGRRWVPSKNEDTKIRKGGLTKKNIRFKTAKDFSTQLTETLARTTPEKSVLIQSYVSDLVHSVNKDRDIKLETFSPKKRKESLMYVSPRKRTHFKSGGHARGPAKKRKRLNLDEESFSSQPEVEDSDLLKKINDKLLSMGSDMTLLKQSDLDILAKENFSGHDLWLNDTIIECVIDLLKIKYEAAKNMQYPSTHQQKGYQPIHPFETFVNVLHATTINHWCVISNVHVPLDERDLHVHVYDSLLAFKEDTPTEVEVIPGVVFQAPYFLRDTCKDQRVIKITPKVCTQQSDQVMCGYFALANAIALLEGKDLSKIVFDSSKLRGDLLAMLKSGEVRMFSHSPGKSY